MLDNRNGVGGTLGPPICVMGVLNSFNTHRPPGIDESGARTSPRPKSSNELSRVVSEPDRKSVV